MLTIEYLEQERQRLYEALVEVEAQMHQQRGAIWMVEKLIAQLRGEAEEKESLDDRDAGVDRSTA